MTSDTESESAELGLMEPDGKSQRYWRGQLLRTRRVLAVGIPLKRFPVSFVYVFGPTGRRKKPPHAVKTSLMGPVYQGTQILLGFVVIPIWLAAGLSDYFCHRASDIEHTSGTRESLLHLLQFGLVGFPLIAAMVLDINSGLLLGLTAFVMVHHVVAFVDVRYANKTRVVTPLEQMVHSFLEVLPITALLLVAAMHFDQVAALFGEGNNTPRFGLRASLHPVPLWYISTVMAGAVVLNLVPYSEELLRTLRHKGTNV